MAKAKKSTAPKIEDLDGANVSKEELETRRKEITSYYEVNIPHLKVQKEYEAPPEGEEAPSEQKMAFDTSKQSGAEAAEQIKRTLKRQSNEL